MSTPRNKKRNEDTEPRRENREKRREGTLYDAVAGRIGRNGFLTSVQLQSDTARPSAPEEVLHRRLNAPAETILNHYDADKSLNPKTQKLPDSCLLKEIHAYVSDFYELTTKEKFDFESLDETALLAMGILLEEACKEALGETGDMVFTEPQSRDHQRPMDRMAQHQIIGRVVPQTIHEYQSSSEEEEAREQPKPRKRQRRRYTSPGE
ncbi:hypothetical protein LTR05_001521 [Lithohypha guttulata]|uniref:Uncharacterized protein n=1 Tax=Lithohypha guttulata TaxID=1690604 RepID=A0AAN7YK95_9EURO|nr:hypothetical protein LTR05_001521 [Lithohypha guttulata]